MWFSLQRIAIVGLTPLVLVFGGTAPATAQAYDPAKDSPLSLLAAPADGIAYFEAATRARVLVAAGQFADAERLAEQLVREYPRDGASWMLLGRVKASLGRHAEAATAFTTAGPLLGWRSPYHPAGVNAAFAHMAAGNHDAALEELRREIFERRNFYVRSRAYDWPQFAPLRANPEFLELVGRPNTTGWSRDRGWRYDLDYLVAEVKRVNPDFGTAPLPAEFTRRYEALKRDIPRLSDEQVFVGINRMLAVLGQGHLSVFPPASNRYLPVRFYAFPEGIFIIGASSEHEALIGHRLVRIGSVAAEEALRRVSAVQSVAGRMQHMWGASDLASTYHLKGVGVIDALDSVSITIEPPSGPVRVVRLATRPMTPGTRQDRLVAPKGVAPPLFLRSMAQNHWELPLPEHDAVYVQVNQMRPDSGETLPQFGRRLREVLSTVRAKNLIVDVRHNNGGDTYSYTELLRTIIGFSSDSDRRVYAIAGRRTFSATANFITDLERLVDPVFVGEASSACCNFAGDPSVAVLPFSGWQAELTSVRWNLSYDVYDGRKEMSPDVPVQLTAAAYFSGRDPVLEAVFRLIAQGTTGRGGTTP